MAKNNFNVLPKDQEKFDWYMSMGLSSLEETVCSLRDCCAKIGARIAKSRSRNKDRLIFRQEQLCASLDLAETALMEKREEYAPLIATQLQNPTTPCQTHITYK